MKIFDLFHRQVLVARESARSVGSFLQNSEWKNDGVVLDFDGIEAVTPSFVDELLGVLEKRRGTEKPFKATFINIPARLSPKYEAIARGRTMSILEVNPGHWVITKE